MNWNLNLLAFDGQRHAFLASHFQAELDSLSYVLQRFRFGLALAHTAWNNRALDHVPAFLVLVDGDWKLFDSHRLTPIYLYPMIRCRSRFIKRTLL